MASPLEIYNRSDGADATRGKQTHYVSIRDWNPEDGKPGASWVRLDDCAGAVVLSLRPMGDNKFLCNAHLLENLNVAGKALIGLAGSTYRHYSPLHAVVESAYSSFKLTNSDMTVQLDGPELCFRSGDEAQPLTLHFLIGKEHVVVSTRASRRFSTAWVISESLERNGAEKNKLYAEISPRLNNMVLQSELDLDENRVCFGQQEMRQLEKWVAETCARCSSLKLGFSFCQSGTATRETGYLNVGGYEYELRPISQMITEASPIYFSDAQLTYATASQLKQILPHRIIELRNSHAKLEHWDFSEDTFVLDGDDMYAACRLATISDAKWKEMHFVSREAASVRRQMSAEHHPEHHIKVLLDMFLSVQNLRDTAAAKMMPGSAFYDLVKQVRSPGCALSVSAMRNLFPRRYSKVVINGGKEVMRQSLDGIFGSRRRKLLMCKFKMLPRSNPYVSQDVWYEPVYRKTIANNLAQAPTRNSKLWVGLPRGSNVQTPYPDHMVVRVAEGDSERFYALKSCTRVALEEVYTVVECTVAPNGLRYDVLLRSESDPVATPIGLNWREVYAADDDSEELREPPSGVERLSAQLGGGMLNFSAEAWSGFSIPRLQINHFVKAETGGRVRYFKPHAMGVSLFAYNVATNRLSGTGSTVLMRPPLKFRSAVARRPPPLQIGSVFPSVDYLYLHDDQMANMMAIFILRFSSPGLFFILRAGGREGCYGVKALDESHNTLLLERWFLGLTMLPTVRSAESASCRLRITQNARLCMNEGSGDIMVESMRLLIPGGTRYLCSVKNDRCVSYNAQDVNLSQMADLRFLCALYDAGWQDDYMQFVK